MADADDTQRYHCSYCGCDITLRLKCAVCTDLDLCLQCFAAGAVAGPHKRDHSYQLIERQLKQRIAELSRYRRNGITRLEDCSEFDSLRQLKQETEKLRESKDGTDLSQSSSEDHEEDLSSVASLALLSTSERKLCQSVDVEADEYLSLKSDILRNSALKRSGYPAKLKLPRHLSSDQRSRLMAFFSKAGWIN